VGNRSLDRECGEAVEKKQRCSRNRTSQLLSIFVVIIIVEIFSVVVVVVDISNKVTPRRLVVQVDRRELGQGAVGDGGFQPAPREGALVALFVGEASVATRDGHTELLEPRARPITVKELGNRV